MPEIGGPANQPTGVEGIEPPRSPHRKGQIMPVRKVVWRSSCHSRGYEPSIKNGSPVPWESRPERLLINLLELSPWVVSYEAQPTFESLDVDGEPSSYVPDVLAKYRDGSEVFYEVKPVARLRVAKVSARMAAAKRHFVATGRLFGIVTDEWLFTEPRATNIERLMYHRREPLTALEKFALQSALSSARPRTIRDLICVVGASEAWRLLGLGVVGVHLELSLNSSTSIYLEGGHRHEKLCA